MPDRSPAGDWTAAAVRIRALEDRAAEDRKATVAMIADARREAAQANEQLRDHLDRNYLTRDRLALEYPSRAQKAEGLARHQQWGLYIVGLIAGVEGVLQIIAQITGGH